MATSSRYGTWTARCLLAAILPTLLVSACGRAGEATPEWTAQTDTVGDTIVVRTVSGQVWPGNAELVPEVTIGTLEGAREYMFGDIVELAVAADGSMYVFDRNMRELRKYAPDGAFVTRFGREGGGPGEFRRPDGLAALRDGRVLLRDPGNARIAIYSAEGDALESWPISSSWSTSSQPFEDTSGFVYTHVLLNPAAPIGEWQHGLTRFSTVGEPVDTIPAPDFGFQAPQLVAQRENGASSRQVPFAPGAAWAYSPLGYFVGGVASRYAVTLLRTPEPPLRIERAAERVPVSAEEREEQERSAIWSMRRTDPNWRWNGPAIPDVKPAFSGIQIGADGRIWVRVPLPSERMEEGAAGAGLEEGPDRPPPLRWGEPEQRFDVFEPDGRYLGQVRVPRLVSLRVMRGDHAWGIARDELDVQYVVRYRIAPAEGPGT